MQVEFNSDGEGWELTDRFGDRSVRVWMEILAIIERTQNRWKLVQRWEFVIARKVRLSPAKVVNIVGWMLEKDWLRMTGERSADGRPMLGELSADAWPSIGQLLASGRSIVLWTPNYWKYHKMRSEVSPSPNLPNLPNLTNTKKPPDRVKQNDLSPRKTKEASESEALFSKNKSPDSEARRSDSELLGKEIIGFRERAAELHHSIRKSYGLADDLVKRVNLVFIRLVRLDEEKFEPVGSQIVLARKVGFGDDQIAEVLEEMERMTRDEKPIDKPAEYMLSVLKARYTRDELKMADRLREREKGDEAAFAKKLFS
jgi:hypothetical protein